MKHKYRLLQNNGRQKRALFDAIGIVSKALFGTLNEDDAKFYNQEIDKVRYNENHLLSLIKKQTIIMETTANVFNKSQSAINNQISALNTRILKVKTVIEELANASQTQRAVTEMESLTSLTTLIIMRYQGVINDILELVTDVRHGKPHPAIVTPAQLETILTTIRKEISSEMRLPSSLKNDNLLSLYRLCHMSTSIQKDRIIYELKIPLPYKENYQLYKVIPLPTMFQNKFVYIQPTMNFPIIDYSREHYYDLSPEELANCVTEDHDLYLCQMMHPLFNIDPKNSICELQLLRRDKLLPPSCNIKQSNHQTVWIQLSQANKWLFSTLESVTIDEICQDQIKPFILSGVGTIEISGNCYLRTPDLTIRGYNTKETQLKNSFIPTLNITEALSKLGKAPNLFENSTKGSAHIKFAVEDDFSALSNQIDLLKKEESKEMKPMDPHTIHHYSLGYTILIIIILFIIHKILKKICTETPKKSKTPRDIELKEDENHQEPGIVFTCH